MRYRLLVQLADEAGPLEYHLSKCFGNDDDGGVVRRAVYETHVVRRP